MPDGKYAHAEIKIGDSHIMMSEENPEWGNKSPQTLGGSPVSFMVYVPDADAAFARALAAGCTQVRRSRISFTETAPAR
jgi:PhnB protein